MKTALLFISILFFSAASFAQNCSIQTDEDGNVLGRSCSPINSDSDSSTDNSGLNGQNLNDASNFDDAISGAEQNAQQSASDSGITQLLGMAMGAAFMTQCGPRNPAACAMAAMSFIDAMASGGNKGNSINFGDSLLPNGGDGSGDTTNDEDPLVQEAQAQLETLEGMGFVSNADGSITTPDGKNLSSGDLSSPSSLQSKGFSAGQAQAALDLLKSAREKAEKEVGSPKGGRAIASVGSSGGGGSSVERPLEDIIIDEDSGSFSKGKSRKKGIGRLPANEAAKLSKNFNGTPIGIAGADIFLIVTKKYEDKDKQKSFINKEY